MAALENNIILPDQGITIDNEMVEFADFDISTVRTQMLLLIVSKTDFSQMKRLRNTNCGRVLQERLTRLLLKMPAFASNT